ncbi:MAG: hypothetical protein ABEJ06_04895 [Haloarculaceae archaeon]
MARGDHRATASDGVAAVERTVELQEQGVIVRLTVSTDRDGEVPVTVEDELPAALAPERVAFHPDHAPADGTATAEGVSFEGVASADADLVAVYGIQVDTESVSEVALTDSRLTVEGDAPDDGGSVRGIIRRVLGRDDGSDGPSARPSGPMDEFDSFPGEEAETESPDEPASDGESTSDSESAASDDGDDPTPPTSELEPAVTRIDSETEGDLVEEAEPPSDAETDSEPATDTDADPMTPDTTDTDERDEPSDRPTDDSTSVAAALAAEIQRGEVPEEDLEVLREELGAELSGSQAARLEHVSSRMDEFAAYADALRTLLDEEGDPAETIAELREEIQALGADLAALQGTVDDLETELATAADERAALRGDVDATATQVATVEEELGEDIAAVGDGLADEIERVERQARAAREGVKSDLADLEATVERVAQLRDALETALVPPAEATADADGATATGNSDGSESESEDADEEPEAETGTQEFGADGGVDLSGVEENDPADDGILDL